MPLLQQPFYVGIATTPSGASRVITVPNGATRLFLGTTGYAVAAFNGTVVATASNATITPPQSGTVMIPGSAAAVSWRET